VQTQWAQPVSPRSGALKKKWGIKELSGVQLGMAEVLARNIVFNEEEATWNDSIKAYVKRPKEITPEVTAEISEIAAQFEVDLWRAAVLSRSKVDAPAG